MAHIWLQLSKNTYEIALLDGTAFGLTNNPGTPVVTGVAEAPAQQVQLRRYRTGSDARWILLAGPTSQVLVNGDQVCGGIRVLADRDEIRFGELRSFFADEEPAHVEPYPGGSESARCPRCQDPIRPGSQSVRCPACGIWHHQHASGEDRRLCWSYAQACAVCGHPTELDAGFRWTPEDL